MAKQTPQSDDPRIDTSQSDPAPDTDEEPVCAVCGKPIAEDDLVCPHCGTSLVAG